MQSDRVSNLGPLALKSDALLTVLCSPADKCLSTLGHITLTALMI